VAQQYCVAMAKDPVTGGFDLGLESWPQGVHAPRREGPMAGAVGYYASEHLPALPWNGEKRRSACTSGQALIARSASDGWAEQC